MKRRLLKLGVFVLLGAIVNVAVAWAASQRNLDIGTKAPLSESQCDLFWNNNMPAQFPRLNESALGVKMTRCGISVEAVVMFIPPNGYYDERYNAILVTAGLPLASMSGVCRSVPREVQFEGLVDSPFMETRPNHTNQGRLPIRPLWPGLAINTIFYAVILWLLWLAPGTIRRFVRIRQHRCPACGYFIAKDTCANGLCSECGARLPWVKQSA